MDTWRGKPEDSELKKLTKERQYVIFVPNPEDETNFSVMVVDTVSSPDKEDEKENFNVSNIIIKGIMYMLDSEFDQAMFPPKLSQPPHKNHQRN